MVHHAKAAAPSNGQQTVWTTTTTRTSRRSQCQRGCAPVSTSLPDPKGISQMSIASIAAQQSAASAAANLSAARLTQSGRTAPASSTAAPSSSTSALSSLSSNFGDFLNLLMTQLQNQDPTSPLDSNQFTSELVQFSSVEQQINTNTSLTQLIQLTQGGEVMQASAMTGKQVTVQSTQVPLQSGQGTINFTAPGAEPVAIAIYNSSGAQLH